MRKVTREDKLWFDSQFANMGRSAIRGIIMVATGVILFVVLFPETVLLLTIFLVFEIICRMLEITKWSERHILFHSLLGSLILAIFTGVIAWWDALFLADVPLAFIIIAVERVTLLFLIFVGSMEFLSLFRYYNYYHVEVED